MPTWLKISAKRLRFICSFYFFSSPKRGKSQCITSIVYLEVLTRKFYSTKVKSQNVFYLKKTKKQTQVCGWDKKCKKKSPGMGLININTKFWCEYKSIKKSFLHSFLLTNETTVLLTCLREAHKTEACEFTGRIHQDKIGNTAICVCHVPRPFPFSELPFTLGKFYSYLVWLSFKGILHLCCSSKRSNLVNLAVVHVVNSAYFKLYHYPYIIRL